MYSLAKGKTLPVHYCEVQFVMDLSYNCSLASEYLRLTKLPKVSRGYCNCCRSGHSPFVNFQNLILLEARYCLFSIVVGNSLLKIVIHFNSGCGIEIAS